MPVPSTQAPDRLLVALSPRTPEVVRTVKAAILRLAADCSQVEFDMIADAAENPDGVTSPEVVDLAGITYRQLDLWTVRGYLVADARGGSGNRRRYRPAVVVKARLMGSLVALFSMSPAKASLIADEIIASGASEVGGFRVTRNGLEP